MCAFAAALFIEPDYFRSNVLLCRAKFVFRSSSYNDSSYEAAAGSEWAGVGRSSDTALYSTRVSIP